MLLSVARGSWELAGAVVAGVLLGASVGVAVARLVADPIGQP